MNHLLLDVYISELIARYLFHDGFNVFDLFLACVAFLVLLFSPLWQDWDIHGALGLKPSSHL